MEYKDFRLRDPEVGSDITAIARENIKWIIVVARKMGYEVIYSDTDSVFILSMVEGDIMLEDDDGRTAMINAMIDEGNRLKDAVNDSFDEFVRGYGLDRSVFKLQFEKIYDPWFQAAEEAMVKGQIVVKGKKRYVGLLLYKDGSILLDAPHSVRKEVKGFEVKRINVSDYAKNVQHNVFDRILAMVPMDDVRTYIRAVAAAIRQGKVPAERMAIPAKVNKESYSPVPAFIRATLYTRDTIGVDLTAVGTDFIYCYGHLRDRPVVHARSRDDCVMAVPRDGKFPDDFVVNVEKMLQRTVKGPLAPITEGLGLGPIDEVLSTSRAASLDAFV
jgi:DNA polymerase elongation subunit (family B)